MATTPHEATPSVIVTNARIATGDPRRPWATALALRGDTLAALASAAEILKMAGARTRVLDAAGRTITLPPGTRVGSRVRVVAGDRSIRIDRLPDSQ